MAKENCAPWYVVLFRIVLVLFFWIFCACVFFCIPFWVDSFFPESASFYHDLFAVHPWLFWVWIAVCLVFSAVFVIRQVYDFGCRVLALDETED